MPGVFLCRTAGKGKGKRSRAKKKEEEIGRKYRARLEERGMRVHDGEDGQCLEILPVDC